MPGQIAADTYEESQRHPGDFEAQVSQRPIAIHGLEHLSATDRGISMFRNQMRRGIRAVTRRPRPRGPVPRPRRVIPTYCNDTVVRLPAAATEAADKKMMRETGPRLAKSYHHEPTATGCRGIAISPTGGASV